MDYLGCFSIWKKYFDYPFIPNLRIWCFHQIGMGCRRPLVDFFETSSNFLDAITVPVCIGTSDETLGKSGGWALASLWPLFNLALSVAFVHNLYPRIILALQNTRRSPNLWKHFTWLGQEWFIHQCPYSSECEEEGLVDMFSLFPRLPLLPNLYLRKLWFKCLQYPPMHSL